MYSGVERARARSRRSGDRSNSLMPLVIRLPRPLVTPLRPPLALLRPNLPGRTASTIPPATITAAAEIEDRTRLPAQRRQHRQAEAERDQARARQREHQAAPEDRERAHRAELHPRAPVVEQHRGHEDHHQRQVAAEDVGVEEDRVDREVLVQLVLDHQLRADQGRRCLVASSTKPISEKATASTDGHLQAADQQLDGSTPDRADARAAPRTGRRRRPRSATP